MVEPKRETAAVRAPLLGLCASHESNYRYCRHACGILNLFNKRGRVFRNLSYNRVLVLLTN